MAAEQLFTQTADGIERTHAAVTERARPHHESLRQAAAALRVALSAARAELGKPSQRANLDAVLVPLKVGYAHLQHAAGALPGFQMVAFEQGCCGSMPAPTAARMPSL